MQCIVYKSLYTILGGKVQKFNSSIVCQLFSYFLQVTTQSKALYGSLTGFNLVKRFPVFIVHKDHYYLNKISHCSVF
jgi:hypothetical protein